MKTCHFICSFSILAITLCTFHSLLLTCQCSPNSKEALKRILNKLFGQIMKWVVLLCRICFCFQWIPDFDFCSISALKTNSKFNRSRFAICQVSLYSSMVQLGLTCRLFKKNMKTWGPLLTKSYVKWHH